MKEVTGAGGETQMSEKKDMYGEVFVMVGGPLSGHGWVYSVGAAVNYGGEIYRFDELSDPFAASRHHFGIALRHDKLNEKMFNKMAKSVARPDEIPPGKVLNKVPKAKVPA
jgi:hypothetical protein